ncbi:MAG: hypothetical protein V1918_08865 [Planctomycetota bacterium]
MNKVASPQEEMIAFFERSFRAIEASKLGETILTLCQAVSEDEAAAKEERHD